MSDFLFIEIDKFDAWARSQYNISQDDIGGEWECDYTEWYKIYSAFENFLIKADPNNWTDKEKERLLYIIARDNESEYLSDLLNEAALIILTKQAIDSGHIDDKWQLAIQLFKLSDRLLATTFLEAFVNDEDEYVNRRALMELAKLNSDKVEIYAELFWNRNKYGDMDEYQKMAVLNSLKTINSKQLDKYIKLAKQDGRKYLVESAIKIETE
jgi:Na+/phosphate symporter